MYLQIDIGYFLAFKQKNIKCIFDNNKIKYINLDIPTPNKTNNIYLKNIIKKRKI